MGDEGCTALAAEALPHLPRLQVLNLEYALATATATSGCGARLAPIVRARVCVS